ncbi:hypothetical protein [Paenimyroides aestuarii]|uniref:Uncharacterized protein n=1 Tax=Paenimyroides aestuarii TaxID=2968490 RepID=A0ABY5NQM8_9FLAO|nr:hypothetical protein [Paenimyroides aestuarii]UUV20871.1 hypothetical protein NPX36_11150 [Paenimyroides aestuarii]
MSPTIIIIVAVLFIGSFIYMRYMMNKQKQAAQKYSGDDALNKTPEMQQELIPKYFSSLEKQMQGAPIDAFTECAHITTVGNKVASAAATAAKTVAWAAVGVKAKYQEADHASYLVLSGDELHYLFFEEGAPKEHLIFDQTRLLNARVGTITNAEKVTRMSAIAQQKPNKLSIDIDGKPVDILYYNEVRRMPETTLAFEKNGMDTQAKFGLLGRYFKKKFFEKYPHLSN